MLLSLHIMHICSLNDYPWICKLVIGYVSLFFQGNDKLHNQKELGDGKEHNANISQSYNHNLTVMEFREGTWERAEAKNMKGCALRVHFIWFVQLGFEHNSDPP